MDQSYRLSQPALGLSAMPRRGDLWLMAGGRQAHLDEMPSR